MDIGAEISKKIQMAITAKLKELDAYVDDELPDYIMIMVANRKTEDQMAEALSLFLSEDTRTFTSWLHNLLSTLRKSRSDKSNQKADSQEPVVQSERIHQETKPAEAITISKIEEAKPSEDELKNQESSSEAVITINAEMDDAFEEELVLQQTDPPIIIYTDVKQETVEEKRHLDQDAGGVVEKGTAGKTIEPGSRSENSHRQSGEGGRRRKESEGKSGQTTNGERKRRSDGSRRRSHRSRSPSSRTKSSERSRDVKDDSTKSSEIQRESEDLSGSKRKKQERRPAYRLESDAKRYTKTSDARSRISDEKSKPIVREWDIDKGQDKDSEIISSWERRKRQEEVRKPPKKEEEKWVLSSDEESPGNRKKGSISSAVRPINREPEFVSDNESDDGDARKTLSVSSKVAYPARKMRVPIAKQANKALLMRAVSEAERSVRRLRESQAQEDTEEEENVLIHSKPPPKVKKSVKDRLSMRPEEVWVEKPAKVKRRSSEKAEIKHKKMTKKIPKRPMYSETENGEKTQKRYKEVIVIRKNVRTGDRISTTSAATEDTIMEEGAADTVARVNRRKKSHTKPAKVIFVDDVDETEHPVTVIHLRSKKHGNDRDKVIYVNRSSSDEEKSPLKLRRDRRNFIHREEHSDDVQGVSLTHETESVVKFDSRRAKPHTKHSPNNKAIETGPKKKQKATAKVSPRPHPAPSATKTTGGSESPRFIVTLDGVAKPSQMNLNQVMPEKPSKVFKYEPITPPVALSTAASAAPIQTPLQKPVVIQAVDHEDDHDDLTDSELMKMRKKLLKVQEEATKLKQMQAKLAAVRGTSTPGRMYADKVDAELRSIYVGNVHFSVSEKQLSEYFSICGKVERVTILKDPYTGHPKGFAYLEFDDKRAVTSALALNNTTFNGRVIRVTLKQSKPAVSSPAPAARAGRFITRRAYPGRAGAQYFRRGYVHAGPRFPTTPKPRQQFPSRNKTWVNPAMASNT